MGSYKLGTEVCFALEETEFALSSLICLSYSHPRAGTPVCAVAPGWLRQRRNHRAVAPHRLIASPGYQNELISPGTGTCFHNSDFLLSSYISDRARMLIKSFPGHIHTPTFGFQGNGDEHWGGTGGRAVRGLQLGDKTENQ